MRIYPFKALRPARQYAGRVAAPPYDVLSTEEARKMAEDNPLSFLHVDKAEIDLPQGAAFNDPAVYAKAGDNLRAMSEDGVMIYDENPCVYLYRLIREGRTQTGLAVCVNTDDCEAGIIKKHEHTRPDKEKDRVDHVLACSAHTGPIFMAYRSNAGMSKLINERCESHKPEYDFKSDDGVSHAIWAVSDGQSVDAFVKAAEALPCVYIADGHHRSAAAVRVAAEVKAEEAKKFLAVIFPQEELVILDYNRLVKDLNGNTPEEFLEKISKDFTVTESSEPVKPTDTYEYGMYISGKWHRLKYKNLPPEDAVASLAVSILQDKLLSPVLNIQDPRSDKRIDFVGGARGTAELERRVDAGETAVAFTVSPTKMDELLSVADAGKVMPPKSTWFEPKLRSGLLIHKF